MTIDLDSLEAKARAATPGPWHLWGSDAVTIEASTFIATASDTRPMPQQQADAAFIAAASPDVVLALVERVRAAEAHWSDCAVNNEPAQPVAPCNCGRVNPSTGWMSRAKDAEAFAARLTSGFGDIQNALRAGQFRSETVLAAARRVVDERDAAVKRAEAAEALLVRFRANTAALVSFTGERPDDETQTLLDESDAHLGAKEST